MGGTCAWKVCGLDQQTAFAVFFEIVNQVKSVFVFVVCVFFFRISNFTLKLMKA